MSARLIDVNNYSESESEVRKQLCDIYIYVKVKASITHVTASREEEE
jgi:hypothetical protein